MKKATKEKRLAKFKALNKKIRACKSCAISKQINQKVFGTGSITGRLLFIGTAPGQDEDIEGTALTGKALKKLQQTIKKAGGKSEEYCILNLLKCKPPKNREPKKKELRNCTRWLEKQIAILKPNLIVPLGSYPTGYFLNTDIGILKLQGKVRIRGRLRILTLAHLMWALKNRDQEAEEIFLESMEKAFTLTREKPDGGGSWYTYLKRRSQTQEEEEKEEEKEEGKKHKRKKGKGKKSKDKKDKRKKEKVSRKRST